MGLTNGIYTLCLMLTRDNEHREELKYLKEYKD